ncbi:MAG: hypothetical protein HY727_16705 [Candidatus Rokubacteria bacterium]|nr:hypothetical protein [Candidatus Rokubacteria bacterium]
MKLRRVTLALLFATLPACASMQEPEDQRTTQGPTAEELWVYRVALQNGREPNFDERRYWENQLEQRITKYLGDHPEVANSVDVSTFRFFHQAQVGMSKEQVLILLGPPLALTTDAGELEKLARRYWTDMKGNVTEAWAYPFGWRLYFNGSRLADITQYRPRK